MESKRNRSISISLIACVLGLLTISCCKKENSLIEIPMVTTGEIENITDNTAVCGGNILSDGGSAITKCGVCWSTDSTELLIEKAHHIEDAFDLDSFKSSITNLTPDSKYFVRAYASNKRKTGYGKTISFKTRLPYENQISFNPNIEYGDLSDQDGNKYKTVTIGYQVWMAENLKAITYNDGKSMVLKNDYYWYNNDVNENKATYGAIYSWKAVNTGKLCPVGWHVPSTDEWNTLALTLDAYTTNNPYIYSIIAGGKLKETGSLHWTSPNTGATNTTGFTALPGGFWRWYNQWDFDLLALQCYFWTSTEVKFPQIGQTLGHIFHYKIKLDFDTESLNLTSDSNTCHGSVRCVKN